MFQYKRVVVVMFAYNAVKTLGRTYDGVMQQGIVDLVIVVDDASHDDTLELARTLPNTNVHIHQMNRGCGANQKTCYRLALAEGAGIVIVVHPDYQYTSKLVPAMVSMVGSGLYHCVLASRMLGGYVLRGGIPWWRYISNCLLTFVENILMGAKPSEFHTGYRAFSREELERLPLEKNSDDFVFDNQMVAQILWYNYTVAEISCPTGYFPEATSINLRRSINHRLGCLATAVTFRLARIRIASSALFPRNDWTLPLATGFSNAPACTVAALSFNHRARIIHSFQMPSTYTERE